MQDTAPTIPVASCGRCWKDTVTSVLGAAHGSIPVAVRHIYSEVYVLEGVLITAPCEVILPAE